MALWNKEFELEKVLFSLGFGMVIKFLLMNYKLASFVKFCFPPRNSACTV
jgi:hypothetical protein